VIQELLSGARRTALNLRTKKETTPANVVADGVKGLFDTALIVSADSDMVPAIRELRAARREARIVGALPPNRNSSDLRAHCDASFRIGAAKIRQAQLPETVMDGAYAITRPPYWK
jgi:uncharacterized LabA/DUF88 family protein